MTTIHYTLNDLDRGMNPSTDRGRLECAQTMRRAIAIARHICSGIDENSSEDTIVTTERFFTDLHFEGSLQGIRTHILWLEQGLRSPSPLGPARVLQDRVCR